MKTVTALYEFSLDGSLKIDTCSIILQPRDKLDESREQFEKEFKEV